jgi:AMMECR1 domain-containing protein
VTYGGTTRKSVNYLAACKGIADKAKAPLRMETLSVERNNAGGFLTAMLKSVQAKGDNRGCIGMTENAEYAALLTQTVAVEI